ncbi:MAG: baseplate J/gp47 family protein [Bacillota bacterium]
MTTMPDFLDEETESAILQRMLARIPDDIDKSEGSYIWDALAPVASEIAQMKVDMGTYLKRGFAATTFGPYLVLRAQEVGLSPRPAVKASGQVAFTGTPGAIIQAGTLLSTTADEILSVPAVEFVTTQDAEIPSGGTITVNIAAREAGAGGNVAAGKINLLVVPVSGVTTVTNAAPTSGGVNAESDSSLLDRYLVRRRKPGASGNKVDYKQWALEVPGVGGVQVVPLWAGNGTVKVVLLDTDKLPATQALVDAVQAYIDPAPALGEGKAPIGATVTVSAAESVSIAVTAMVIHDGTRSLAGIRADYEWALASHFKEIAFRENEDRIRYGKMGSLLLNVAGVLDYSDLLLNGGTANVAIAAGEVAVLGTVMLNE